MGFINSKIVKFLFSLIIFNANTVLSLVVLDSETTQSPSVSEIGSEEPPLSSPEVQSKLSQLFLKCSSECSGIPDCLGITIYKLNAAAEQLVDSMDSFSCVPTINDNVDILHSGKIFYKIMFKDRLPKVQRRNFIVRNSRALSSDVFSIEEDANMHEKRENSPAIEVEPPSATAAPKIQPVKIDPLFTETTTVAGITADPKSATLPAGKIGSLFGENKPPASTTENPKEGGVNTGTGTTTVAPGTTTVGSLASIFEKETSSSRSSQKGQENSIETAEITTVKSSEMAPVKINQLFTETTTVSPSDIAVHPENSTVSVDSLFEQSSNSSSGLSSTTPASVEANTTKTNQSEIITNVAPENTTAEGIGTISNTLTNKALASEKIQPNIIGESIPIITDSSNKSSSVSSTSESSGEKTASKSEQAAATYSATLEENSTSTLPRGGDSKAKPAIVENTSENATETAVESSCSENRQNSVSTTKNSNEPVRIDPLFSETTTVSGLAVAKPENSAIHVSVDNLFETHSSSSSTHDHNISTPLSTSIPEATTATSISAESHPGETTSQVEHHNSTNASIATDTTEAEGEKVSLTETISGVGITNSGNSTKVSQVSNITTANLITSGSNTENLFLSTKENSSIISPSGGVGDNIVTDKPTIILEEPPLNNASTEQPLFGNGDSTTIKIQDKSTSFHPGTIVDSFTEISVSSQTSSSVPNFSSTKRPEDILQSTAPVEKTSTNSATPGAEEMSCDTTMQSTASFLHEDSVPKTESPEIHTGEMDTAPTIPQDNNSHRIFAGESSAVKKDKNEDSDVPYSASHVHKAEVSEVKNEDGTTSIVLKAKIKIKINLEESSDLMPDAPSPQQIQTTKYYETTENDVGTFLKNILVTETADTECLFQDSERYLRNIKGTAFSKLNGYPTLLSFVSGVQSHCFGTLMKNGTMGMHAIQSILPGFPLDVEVDAAGFLNNRLYVIDASKEQNVWSFEYDFNTRGYSGYSELSSISTKQEFLQLCQVNTIELASDIRIKAFAQVSLHDNSCIIFDESRTPILSDNASEEALSLAKAISFLLETEFINYVEAVFAWLDESFISSTYIYGSNGDLYRLFRNATTDFKWQTGNYELLPYPQLPLTP